MTSPELTTAMQSFSNPRGYLAAASTGLPPRAAVDALTADLDAWVAASTSPQAYDAVIERTRASYARLVNVDVDRVAQGSQTSVLASLVAAAVPEGAEVLCVEGDFSSMVFPFLHSRARVRSVELSALADSISDDTWLVAFSLIQSSNGALADVPAILEAAGRHGARTFADVTQAAGVYPVDASRFDATVCHAYKWLCSPRGVAFLTVTDEFDSLLTPVHAGWYAGEDPWQNCYGPAMDLARTARRFDVSPAWQAWVGAEFGVGLFADLDMHEVWSHTAGLGDALCDALGIARTHQAIVSWPDASGGDLAKLRAAGITAAGRAGRLRASFHIWNDLSDVESVVRALR